jgi:hypothetical protein
LSAERLNARSAERLDAVHTERVDARSAKRLNARGAIAAQSAVAHRMTQRTEGYRVAEHAAKHRRRSGRGIGTGSRGCGGAFACLGG